MWINLVRIIAIIKYTALKYLTPCGREKKVKCNIFKPNFSFQTETFRKTNTSRAVEFFTKNPRKKTRKKALAKTNKNLEKPSFRKIV